MNKGEQERAFMFCLSRRIHSIIHPLLFTGIGKGFGGFSPNGDVADKGTLASDILVTKSSPLSGPPTRNIVE